MALHAWIQAQRQWRQDHLTAFAGLSQRMPDGLTQFQHRAVAELSDIIPPNRYKRVVAKRPGDDYLIGSFGVKGIEVYIYRNEAGAREAPNSFTPFEEWDFRTPEDLFKALVGWCKSRVT